MVDSSLLALRERVEAATGPDRELDAEIVAYLNKASVRRYPPSDDFGPHDRWQFWSLDGAHFLGSEGKFPVPAYTGSIDSASALIEKIRPGWAIGCISEKLRGCIGYIHNNEMSFTGVSAEPNLRRKWFESRRATRPLALIDALLKSIEADQIGA